MPSRTNKANSPTRRSAMGVSRAKRTQSGGTADCAKQSQFGTTRARACPELAEGTPKPRRDDCAKQSQTWAGWGIWDTAHGAEPVVRNEANSRSSSRPDGPGTRQGIPATPQPAGVCFAVWLAGSAAHKKSQLPCWPAGGHGGLEMPARPGVWQDAPVSRIRSTGFCSILLDSPAGGAFHVFTGLSWIARQPEPATNRKPFVLSIILLH
jgi:hypothetical protein